MLPLFLLLQPGLAEIAQVLGYIAIIVAGLAIIIGVIWSLWNSKNQAHWKDLAESQAKKIAFLQGELGELKAEVAEIKHDLHEAHRVNEDLRKANLRLQGIHETGT